MIPCPCARPTSSVGQRSFLDHPHMWILRHLSDQLANHWQQMISPSTMEPQGYKHRCGCSRYKATAATPSPETHRLLNWGSVPEMQHATACQPFSYIREAIMSPPRQHIRGSTIHGQRYICRMPLPRPRTARSDHSSLTVQGTEHNDVHCRDNKTLCAQQRSDIG